MFFSLSDWDLFLACPNATCPATVALLASVHDDVTLPFKKFFLLPHLFYLEISDRGGNKNQTGFHTLIG
jgi:hypothetical protein